MLTAVLNNRMDQQYIKKTSISGLLKIERITHSDERGFFREVFHMDELREALGFEFKPVQMNHSHSLPNVLRGIHAEQWNKIIYPVCGEVFIAIVDIRPDLKTFGEVETFNVTDENRFGLFIPNGLANSLCVVGKRPVDYIYLVDEYWDGSDTRAIAWDDPDLNIKWPVKEPILSGRDKNNPGLREVFPEKFK